MQIVLAQNFRKVDQILVCQQRFYLRTKAWHRRNFCNGSFFFHRDLSVLLRPKSWYKIAFLRRNMKKDDPRLIVGARVLTKAIYVSKKPERTYGTKYNARSKTVFGTVIDITRSKPTPTGRLQTYIIADWQLGERTKRWEVRSEHVKPATPNDQLENPGSSDDLQFIEGVQDGATVASSTSPPSVILPRQQDLVEVQDGAPIASSTSIPSVLLPRQQELVVSRNGTAWYKDDKATMKEINGFVPYRVVFRNTSRRQIRHQPWPNLQLV